MPSAIRRRNAGSRWCSLDSQGWHPQRADRLSTLEGRTKLDPIMLTLYRLDKPGADAVNPRQPRQPATRRVPGNVPYLVDNLWEWARPDHCPSRRYAVYASPSPELAHEAGGAVGGSVYRVEFLGDVRAAQVQQKDARFHPEAMGSQSLNRFVIRLLGQNWVDAPLAEKLSLAPLWSPCLSREEVESVIADSALAPHREAIGSQIKFWSDVQMLSQDHQLPYAEGEVFFEAASWQYILMDPIIA